MSDSGEEKQVEIFNYLSVIISIILGLGLGHLLTGCARLIATRQTLTISWLYVSWIVLLFPVYVTYWWAFWDYRKHVHWSFVSFFFLLIGPTGLYLITALLLPDLSNKICFNATAHYLNIRYWFFVLWIVLQIWGIMLSPWLKEGIKLTSFLNRYKYAQYLLLLALVSGFFNVVLSRQNLLVDTGALSIFWLVLVYLLSAHRRILKIG